MNNHIKALEQLETRYYIYVFRMCETPLWLFTARYILSSMMHHLEGAHTRTHTHTQPHTHTRSHTHTHKNTHTQPHTHTHTHTPDSSIIFQIICPILLIMFFAFVFIAFILRPTIRPLQSI